MNISRAQASYDALNATSRTRALTDSESLTLEWAMRKLGMLPDDPVVMDAVEGVDARIAVLRARGAIK